MKIRFARLTRGQLCCQIQQAIGALQRAKEHLQAAAHDFGGHRAAAIRAVDEAIGQLEICLNY